MKRSLNNRLARLLPLALVALLQGCDQPSANNMSAQEAITPITIHHALGSTVIDHRPHRVAALDMNEVDFLDQLDVPVVGMPKDFIPHFLEKYRDDPTIEDLGAIVRPNLERVHRANPDLILMTSLQANDYNELTQIAPTLHFDVDYRNSQTNHIDVVMDHLMDLGQIFGKQKLARQRAAELLHTVEEVRRVTQGRPEKALILLHNNGAFHSFGVQSRYGFIFTEFGVAPAAPDIDTGLHGQPVSSEFIQQADPDIIYVVDRTAVMEHRPTMSTDSLANPLLRQTNAWRNDRVVFVDPEAWYVTAASVSALAIIADDIIDGYRH
ncbi:MAG: siderophore ABC transporter substrate-binding protein [Halomonadaceae bacterium]|uniref:Siderophore ABC transporter substrate-binding protein n=1 Tax=Halomonas colorata TaxID=2742615 RepID=A0ABR9FZQ0_9GAMM|nr:siderophore ABC transporter substrate-binding protein [Halomonas colorata]MBE0464102.1 siderophore ABC transporter substrate-binding protein [Halomonas colorata]